VKKKKKKKEKEKEKRQANDTFNESNRPSPPGLVRL
jgi:hypothetical protein